MVYSILLCFVGNNLVRVETNPIAVILTADHVIGDIRIIRIDTS